MHISGGSWILRKGADLLLIQLLIVELYFHGADSDPLDPLVHTTQQFFFSIIKVLR